MNFRHFIHFDSLTKKPTLLRSVLTVLSDTVNGTTSDTTNDTTSDTTSDTINDTNGSSWSHVETKRSLVNLEGTLERVVAVVRTVSEGWVGTRGNGYGVTVRTQWGTRDHPPGPFIFVS